MVGYITTAHDIAQRLSEKWRHFVVHCLYSLFCTSPRCVGVSGVHKPLKRSQSGNSYVFGLVQLSQANDYFFARKREKIFWLFFFARKREFFFGVFWCFLVFFFVLFWCFFFVFRALARNFFGVYFSN